MGTIKLQREVTRGIEALGVEVVEMFNKKGHIHIRVKLPGGAVRLVTMSGSPSIPEHTISNVVKDVRRLLNGRH